MLKLVPILFGVLLLVGCASSGKNSSMALSEEEFLALSANNTRLIELYKDRLREQDSPDTRLKLAKVYLDTGDNESSLFTLSSLIKSNAGNSEAFYLQGVAQYNLGQLRQAENSLNIAINKDDDSAKAVNMMGVVKAELGHLAPARQQFNKAREMMYDDLVVKNNLALLDMLEGKYQDAAVRLMPIYLNNPDRADPKLKANLAIILSKMGSFETLRRVYGDKYTDTQLFDIFNDLKASLPVSRVYGPSAINPRLEAPLNLPHSKESSYTIETEHVDDQIAIISTEPLAPLPTIESRTITAPQEPKKSSGFFSWFSSKKKAKKEHNFVPLSPYSLRPNDGFNIPIAQLRSMSLTTRAVAQQEE
ncbi:tetratricopeptide repeat protein [Marinomonas atlantica]|uniref:tetratricopeptide repeat protein n=1 Tax=Marinomonas atlantica TaxID=1806668 RepID=UPI00082A66A4|nr:tetratricopeptide repeat protein [Marinomonas atlantica]